MGRSKMPEGDLNKRLLESRKPGVPKHLIAQARSIYTLVDKPGVNIRHLIAQARSLYTLVNKPGVKHTYFKLGTL